MPVAASEGALCRRRAGKRCGPRRAGCVGELLRPRGRAPPACGLVPPATPRWPRGQALQLAGEG